MNQRRLSKRPEIIFNGVIGGHFGLTFSGLARYRLAQMLNYRTKACGGILPNHCYKPFLCVFGLTINLKSMEWDNKVKMIQLGNQRHNSEESKKEFQKFVLENVDSFDGQAWDMFCNLVDLIIDEMKKEVGFWKQVYAKIKDVDCNDEKFGFRSGMRIAMIQTICEDELSFS